MNIWAQAFSNFSFMCAMIELIVVAFLAWDNKRLREKNAELETKNSMAADFLNVHNSISAKRLDELVSDANKDDSTRRNNS